MHEKKLENLSTDIYIALLILGGRHEELSSCSAKETSWSVPQKKKIQHKKGREKKILNNYHSLPLQTNAFTQQNPSSINPLKHKTPSMSVISLYTTCYTPVVCG